MWCTTIIRRDGGRQAESFETRMAARDCARVASQQPEVFVVEVMFVATVAPAAEAE
jgi:hypothetical protein